MNHSAFLDTTSGATTKQEPHWFKKLASFCDPNQDDVSCDEGSSSSSSDDEGSAFVAAPDDNHVPLAFSRGVLPMKKEPLVRKVTFQDEASTDDAKNKILHPATKTENVFAVSKSPQKSSIQIDTVGMTSIGMFVLMFAIGYAAIYFKGNSMFDDAAPGKEEGMRHVDEDNVPAFLKFLL